MKSLFGLRFDSSSALPTARLPRANARGHSPATLSFRTERADAFSSRPAPAGRSACAERPLLHPANYAA
jgi:hypothetical protein